MRRAAPAVAWVAISPGSERGIATQTRGEDRDTGGIRWYRRNPTILNVERTPVTEALIIDACRTPRGVGKVGKGALADIHPQQLGATVLAAIRDRNDLDTSTVDDVIFGTSMQVGTQGGDLARMALLDAGYDTKASGVTLDRFCGSGITATNIAANAIMAGMEDLVVGGGTAR